MAFKSETASEKCFKLYIMSGNPGDFNKTCHRNNKKMWVHNIRYTIIAFRFSKSASPKGS